MWFRSAVKHIIGNPENLRYEDNPRDEIPDSGNTRDIAGTGLSVLGFIILTFSNSQCLKLGIEKVAL